MSNGMIEKGDEQEWAIEKRWTSVNPRGTVLRH
jgi:hypothetical protein